jgi:hypothetical protein
MSHVQVERHNAALQRRRAISIQLRRKRLLEKHAIAPSAASAWRKRWVHKGPLLLFVTYNSDSQDLSVETEAVNQMLSTLKSR